MTATDTHVLDVLIGFLRAQITINETLATLWPTQTEFADRAAKFAEVRDGIQKGRT